METWALLWKLVFFMSVGLFAAMSLWVIIGGAFDIKRMLSDLRHLERLQNSEDAGQ